MLMFRREEREKCLMAIDEDTNNKPSHLIPAPNKFVSDSS